METAQPNELPKAYSPKEVEDRIYQAWEKSGFFNPDNLPGARRETFCIMMPPPNATGTLHIGHAMFLTLEDLMTRFERLRGRAALWLPGTDHAAIATNTKVEKLLAKEGKTKYDLGREGFVRRVEEYIEGSRGTIRKQVRKMGASCDWSREAYTFDAPRSRVVREMFVRMYNDGLIYRGYRIVNWCPRCESTLADDEVLYKEEPARLYYMKYGPFVVATTRPETKLGDTAVAVNPNDPRYQKMIGQTFEVDFDIGSQTIRVIADEGVDMTFGTGVLGVTPAHSAIDFAMAEKNGLPMKKVIGEDGKMTALAGKYAGLPVEEARHRFLIDLRAAGLIEKEEEINHKLPVCYRCGTTIEPLTSRQWFVDVDHAIALRDGKTLKQLAIEVVVAGRIKIIPDRFEKVYLNWMNSLHDWCISRQIWFGHRVPVWYRGKETFVGLEAPAGDGWTQDTDTLDTWFSSGTWTFSTLGWPEQTKDLKRFHPTQVLETGYDILFFWIARMILMTTYALGEVPFEKVYLHGLVRDEQGRKMSKSLENIIDPLDVSEKYGTDAVRLSLTIGNSAGNDLKMSEEKIEYYRNFTNKLWNISRFILLKAKSSRGVNLVKPPKAKTLADQWILARLAATVETVTQDMEALNFSRAGETLRDFTWNELADWYLEIAKIEDNKDEMLVYLLGNVLKLWHPFMPFVTEEVWQLAFAKDEKDFLMVAEWPSISFKKAETQVKSFELIREVIVALRNIRATYNVEAAKKIEAVIYGGGETKLLEEQSELIKKLARVEKLTVTKSGQPLDGAASAVVGGMQIFVPLTGMVDLVAERARLQKEFDEVQCYGNTLRTKLSNETFAAKAPAAVVAAEKQKLAAAEEKLTKLKEQLMALK